MNPRRPVHMLLIAAAILPALLSAAPGNFRGTIVEPPSGEEKGKVLYIKGRNGMVRRVDITAASVVYESTVPESRREKRPASALKSGIEVRVTADQGDNGDWKASEIEIVDPEQRSKPVERETPALIDEHTSVT